MTVAIKLLPDELAELPPELVDDGIVATYLQDMKVPKDVPIDSWRQIERVVMGGRKVYILRVRGVKLTDVPDKTLQETQELITTNVNGVKTHPNGWYEVEEKMPQSQ